MIRDFPIPPALAARLADAAESGRAVAATREAATVMVVEDHPDGVRVVAFPRRRSMAFAPGMLVFPGGAVEPADAELARRSGGDGAGGGAVDAVLVAAVRETFEECGVLLADRGGAGEPGRSGGGSGRGVSDQLDTLRQRLLDEELDFAGVLDAAGARVDARLLRPWARWITPEVESRRFDTHFFLARMPRDQQVRSLGSEADPAHADAVDGGGGTWLTAAEAVRRHDAGELAMLPPTRVCMEELAAAPSVGALFATVRAVRPVMPWLVAGPAGGGPADAVLRVDLDGRGGGRPSS